MRVLITGGCGFIGGHLIRYWLQTYPHDHVVNLDALTYAADQRQFEGIDTSRYTFVHGDICDPVVVQRVCDHVDVIIHCAAETHVDRSIHDGQAFLRTNVLGTHVLLDEFRRRRAQIRRFHHVSTDEVFGALSPDDTARFTEASPYRPNSPYSASKAAADHLCRAYHRTYDLPITVSQCSNNYGPYQFPEKFIPVMVTRALADRPLPIYGDGRYIRDWIHVEDHCRGIDAIVQRGVAGEVYCLGGDAEYENRAVAQMILERLGKPLSLMQRVEDRLGHDRRYAIDFTKAREQLEWSPRWSFTEGLQQATQWYRDHATWWQPLLKKTEGEVRS